MSARGVPQLHMTQGLAVLALTYVVDANAILDVRAALSGGGRNWDDILPLPEGWELTDQARDSERRPCLDLAAQASLRGTLRPPYSALGNHWMDGYGRGWLLLMSSRFLGAHSQRATLTLLVELKGDPQDWVTTAQVLFDPGVHLSVYADDEAGPVAHLGDPTEVPASRSPARITRNHRYPLTTWIVTEREKIPELTAERPLGEWPSRMIRKQPTGAYSEVTGGTRPDSQPPGASALVVGDTCLQVLKRPEPVHLVTSLMADAQVAVADATVQEAHDRSVVLFRMLSESDQDGPIDEVRNRLRLILTGLRESEDNLALAVRPVVSGTEVIGGVGGERYARARSEEAHLAAKFEAAREALDHVETSVRLRRDELQIREAAARQHASDQILRGLVELLTASGQVRIVASVASVFLVLLNVAALFAALGSFPSEIENRWLGPVANVFMATALLLSIFLATAVVLVQAAGQGRPHETRISWVGLAVSSLSAVCLGYALIGTRATTAAAGLGVGLLIVGILAISLLVRERGESGRRPPTEPSKAQPSVECILLAVDHGAFFCQALPRVPKTPRETPTDVAVSVVRASGRVPRYVHSTSWRYQPDPGVSDETILTYAAIVPLDNTAGWEPLNALPYLPGDGRPAIAEVASHALRHLALLARSDETASRQMGPEWLAALRKLDIAGAGELGRTSSPK